MQEDIHTITDSEAKKLFGGAGAGGLTAAFIAATVGLLRLLYGFGQNLGSSAYRRMNNITCR